MTELWYLSFCDTDRPKGSQFVGACIVEAYDMGSAVMRAHVLGCNPGGDVQGHHIPKNREKNAPPELRGVLLTREQVESMDD